MKIEIDDIVIRSKGLKNIISINFCLCDRNEELILDGSIDYEDTNLDINIGMKIIEEMNKIIKKESSFIGFYKGIMKYIRDEYGKGIELYMDVYYYKIWRH